MSFLIRQAEVQDSARLLAIYAYYVENTTISFEVEVPTLAEFARRVETISREYPFLVCMNGDDLCGYAYASRHRERAAYRYDVDVSAYVKEGMQGKGAGSALYAALFDALAQGEYYNAYAGVALPNERSLALHRKFGFQPVGVYHHTGYKFGKWHDVMWLEKKLRDYDVKPGKG
jgi:phosphinothricin acetyltransferase